MEVIFTVSPGATSTKCALFERTNSKVKCIAKHNSELQENVISQFPNVSDQLNYREKLVINFIESNLPCKAIIVGCAGRGGMLTPVPSGAIKVNKKLVNFCLQNPQYNHASNLGGPLAYKIANIFGVDAFIVDPVSVDEFTEIARISGCKDFPRFSFVHALNIRETVRKLSNELNIPFKQISCVVAHLGSGFSIATFDKGKIIDNDNRMGGAPFTPERAGGVPPIPLVEACFSGKYLKEEILSKLYGKGGVYGYLGTKNIKEVMQKVKEKEKNAKLIYDAMIYQICKEIAAMSSVLSFKQNGIIVTGGLANNDKIVNDISKKICNIGNIYVYPGSYENESLANTVNRILKGEEKFKEWPVYM